MIYGYETDECPFCRNKTVVQVEGVVVCPVCGVLDPGATIGKLLSLPAGMGSSIYNSGLYGKVKDGEINAYYRGYAINSCQCGVFQYNYPSLFPGLPGEGNVIIVDDVMLTVGGPPSAVGFNTWSQFWNGNFSGRQVTILYKEQEFTCRQIAQSLKLQGSDVRLAPFTGDWEKDELNAKESFVRSTDGCQKKQLDDLREIIDQYHVCPGPGGSPIYKKAINAPLRIIVQDVIDWFRRKGATFLWDDDCDIGYMMFNKEMYPLDHRDAKLKSLMWNAGGILQTSSEGACIIEGMCCQAHESDHLHAEPYINVDPEKGMIELRQSPTVIAIGDGNVIIHPYASLTYDMILKNQKWFKPIELMDNGLEGLQLLWPTICRRMAIPDVAREIVLCWICGIYLQGYSSIRPGLRLYGPPSTGKSTMLQILNWFFYGNPTNDLTSISTSAGLWRKSSLEPFLALDNLNVTLGDFGEGLRTFLDLSSTGGTRVIGVQGSGIETKTQRANSFVAISGLDSFLHHDVKTRYIEVETDPKERSDFFAHLDKPDILRNRNAMWSSMFRLISNNILPSLNTVFTRDSSITCRKILGEKERIVDYFLVMAAIGQALQHEGIFNGGDIITRWSSYIKERSSETSVRNSSTMHWWNNFRIASAVRSAEFGELLLSGEGHYATTLTDGDKLIGISGTDNQLLAVLSWTAKVLNQNLPWKSVKDYANAIRDDRDAWKSSGWTVTEGTTNEIRWKE